MILNVLTDLKSLCGLSSPFLFPNKLRPIKYKQNETEGDFILHTKLSVVRATTVAAQSGCKDHHHQTYKLVTFTQQQQDMVLSSQWLCGYGDKYYFPRLPTTNLQCLFPLRLQKNGVTLGVPNWHTAWSRCSASTFNCIMPLLRTVRYGGSMREFQLCKKEKKKWGIKWRGARYLQGRLVKITYHFEACICTHCGGCTCNSRRGCRVRYWKWCRMVLRPIFVVEIGGRRKILLPFSWWSAVDFGAGGSYKIIFIFTMTITINTKHTYIR